MGWLLFSSLLSSFLCSPPLVIGYALVRIGLYWLSIGCVLVCVLLIIDYMLLLIGFIGCLFVAFALLIVAIAPYRWLSIA